MATPFTEGADDATEAPAVPPIAPPETLGANYAITVRVPQRGVQEPVIDRYLMPSVHSRNGSMNIVTPAIVHTPLGALMPGPDAIPPPVPAGGVGAIPVEGLRPFDDGVRSGYPEGCPVPIK